jgi:DNA-binding transcriptional LysR family regulator
MVDFAFFPTAVLTLACTPSIACSAMADEIARFRAAHPRVRVWLQATTTRDIIDQAHKRQIDFGVIYTPADEARLTVEPLYTTELVCVLPPAHPLAARRVIEPDDLRDQPLITNVRNDPIAALLEQAFGGIRRDVMIGTNHTPTACALVMAGASIAIVEPIAVAKLFPGTVQRPLRPRITITPRIVSSAQQPMSRLARRFAQQLKAAMVAGAGAAAP